MKLSEELEWRGFLAKTTLEKAEELDSRENKKFYWGADPSADSLTIGNLAALMMCACFVRHGYEPYLLVGGATGQIGDPKENGERELKALSEVEHNKVQIRRQVERVLKNCAELSGETDKTYTFLDNLDWFKEIKFLDFLREVGKSFSMTQLLDRQFVQNRIGEGGSGISYAEFSYTLIQGYDFLHLFRKYGVDLQVCGADQFGNCASGIHLIKRLENARADVWSTPLIIDPVSGRKFGKSEGNAVWLAGERNGRSENFTAPFDFYQFWLNQADEAVEYLLKIYTLYPKEEVEEVLAKHREAPEKRLAQKMLARGATEVVHGKELAQEAEWATEYLFGKEARAQRFTSEEIERLEKVLGEGRRAESLIDFLVQSELSSSKSEAKKLVKSGAISFNGEKILDETFLPEQNGVVKRGRNKIGIWKIK